MGHCTACRAAHASCYSSGPEVLGGLWQGMSPHPQIADTPSPDEHETAGAAEEASLYSLRGGLLSSMLHVACFSSCSLACCLSWGQGISPLTSALPAAASSGCCTGGAAEGAVCCPEYRPPGRRPDGRAGSCHPPLRNGGWSGPHVSAMRCACQSLRSLLGLMCSRPAQHHADWPAPRHCLLQLLQALLQPPRSAVAVHSH